MIYLGLINNIALIIALSIFYSFIIRRWKYGSRLGQAISGFLFGAVAIVAMMNPLIISPGLIFDGRSIIISIAGFIGGWVPALIAALMAIIYRAWLGGPGGIMGISVIVSSAAIGIAYHTIRRRRPHMVTPLYLIGFGIIVHICMLALTMTLPSSMKYEVLSAIALPVILIYPLGMYLVCVVFLDLESHLRTEDALRESEGRYRELYDFLPIPVYEMDLETNITSANRAIYETFRGSEEDLKKGLKSWQLISPEEIEKSAKNIERLLKGELVEGTEYNLMRLDGSVFPAIIISSTIYSDGKPVGLRGAIVDITERKQAEEALRERDEQLRLTLDAARAVAWTGEVDGEMVTEIGPVAEVFGKPAGFRHANRREFLEDIHADDRAQVIATLQSLPRGGSDSYSVEFRVPLADGGVRWLQASGRFDYDLEGRPVLVRGITRDITERKRAEEESRKLEERLQRAEKMEALGLLAGGVAHDLNNVLGIVVGYAELLLNDLNESSPMRDSLLNIMDGGQRAAAIVQDLLTLTRRGVSGRKVLSLNRLILDYKKSPVWEKLLSYHPAVKIKTDLEPDLLNISGSSVHLEKSLFNLVSNANEAMPKGGILTLKTTNQYLDKAIPGFDHIHEGDYVVLSVADTGEGISTTDLKRIFEPFYTKKIMGRSGTGLGLAVVWGTVKDHNGYIDVQSEEGKGTIFKVYFPVAREEITAEASSISMSEYSGQGESILVVDDVKGQRDLAATMLKKLNYNVASVSSGEEAVEYLREHKVDLLVLDMIMDPGLDGLDTYKSILKNHPQQKAIIVSGFSESDRVESAQALGAGAYVRKPYVIEKLGLSVRKELDKT